MKRMSLLLAGTAIPLALLLTPDVSARETAQPRVLVAQATQDIMILAQREGRGERGERRRGRDGQADDAAEDAEVEAEEAAAEAAEAEARAAALAAEAAAAQAAAAAADAEAEAEAAAAAAALAEEAEAAAREAAEARAQAEAAEREAAEVRARAEAAAAAEAEAEAASEREATETAEREAAAAAEAEAATAAEPTVAEPAREERRRERERAPETQAVPEPAPAPVEAPAAVAEPTPAPTEAAPAAEPRATEIAPERERRERRRDRDPAAATTTEAPALELQIQEEPQRFQDVREGRRERVQEGVTIIEEPGARTILQEGDQLIIRQDEEERARRTFRDVRRERRGDQEVLVAPRDGGVEIITILDTEGNLLRRIRREADGRETVLIDNTRDLTAERWDWRTDRRSDRRSDRREDRRADDRRGDRLIGRADSVFEFRIDVPPPVVRIPRERYIVDYGAAYRDDYLEEIFLAPPVSEIRDRYTLDEVRFNPNLRDYMPRVDLDTVTFDTGSWQLTRAQIGELERVADAMNSVIDANPDEIFLVEGHTDAVGRAIDNLSLSDRRAESVAFILSEYYDVPPENLVTQGYGEEFLKIDTQAAERRNRRVTIRRITPLMAEAPRG
jgi:outer membrane protein OmpA-like peptidoglycan-associated protein